MTGRIGHTIDMMWGQVQTVKWIQDEIRAPFISFLLFFVSLFEGDYTNQGISNEQHYHF